MGGRSTLNPAFCVQSCVYFAASASKKRLVPHWLLHFGAAGVFGTALFDSSPVPTPIPAAPDILIIILGARGEWPWLLALCGVAGSLIGSYLTWAAGKKGGEAMLDRYMKQRRRERINRWIRGHGMRTIAIAGLLPPPLPTMPILLAAGALGVTRRQLLVAMGVARGIRYGAEAAIAVIYGHQILRFARRYFAGYSNIILYSFLGLIGAGILFGLWKWKHDQHRSESSRNTDAKAA